ncbi:PDZ domain-containing protein [Caproiciproducens sp. MSJ-32]|uniref:PDZ domain-containing protein n=1 Tax=Caproiciproducens sp. MSJ-32 TaxID=2841527 RepID=UPI001C12497D|nr:PDZ domain-containing protein [Caproiciproducens sp. MSJ-32]MBU5454658.1 PDZ domain-containing protein [Caproiciproducens sp. MSJ-32]
MDLILYILRAVAYAIIEPVHMITLVVLGVIFYFRNKKVSMMQKLTLGESINSPLELTLSQLSLGIIAGAIASVILGLLGVMFDENSGIEFIFLVSIVLLFFKKKYMCFSYSSSILGLISILSKFFADITNTEVYLNIDILSLMTFVGIMHIIEGFLVMADGSRGAISVFTNKDNKILGGFAYNRFWPLPVALFIIFLGDPSGTMTTSIETPNWWPILNHKETILILASTIISAIPFYGVLSYNSITFTMKKKEKTLYSGVGILIYGLILSIVSQLAVYGIVGQIVVIIFAPIGHELMLKIQEKLEKQGKYIYYTDDSGVSVLEVSPYSYFYRDGIRRGDRIIEVNNEKALSEVDVIKVIKKELREIPMKVKRISGEIVDLRIIPEKNRLGILLVPKMVQDNKMYKVEENNFKKVLEEMKRKK